jgi:hypothetical protein
MKSPKDRPPILQWFEADYVAHGYLLIRTRLNPEDVALFRNVQTAADGTNAETVRRLIRESATRAKRRGRA